MAVGDVTFAYSVADHDQRPIDRILAARAAVDAGRVALLWRGREAFSYGALDDLASRIAAGLAAIGVNPGDRVGLMAWNRPEVVLLQFGLSRLGAVLVTINAHARGLQLQHIVSHAQLRALVVDADLRSFLDEAIPMSSMSQPAVIVLPPIDAPDGADANSEWAAVLAADPEEVRSLAPVKHSDLQQILYTSGTTGPSKGVMITHNQMYAFADYVAQAMELDASDVYYTCLPLFHINAQLSVVASILCGGTAALYERFHPATFWDDLNECSATAFSLFGAMAYILHKDAASAPPTELRPRKCWAFPAPYDILDEFEERFRLRVLTAYASTEANFVALTSLRAERRPRSVGTVNPRFEVRVVDENDEPLPAGQTGEIVTRPLDAFTMMLGYFDMPATTSEAFRNLWYHTGDAGYFDEDGFLYFVDRIKDVIRRRGENVSSYEVEQVVNTHPDVLESAAVAVPSDLSEDEIKICVVPRHDRIAPDELIAWCESRMARFMIPRYVEVMSELPKTANGKVEKHRLRSKDPESTWDREQPAEWASR